jgi:hypothetical protein
VLLDHYFIPLELLLYAKPDWKEEVEVIGSCKYLQNQNTGVSLTFKKYGKVA